MTTSGETRLATACRKLSEMIRDGEWAPEQPLEPLKELAPRIGVPASTLRHALERLRDDGILIETARGYRIGTLVENRLRRAHVAHHQVGVRLPVAVDIAGRYRLSLGSVVRALQELEDRAEVSPPSSGAGVRHVLMRGALADDAWIARHDLGWLVHPAKHGLIGRYFLVATHGQEGVLISEAPTPSKPEPAWVALTVSREVEARVRNGHVRTLLRTVEQEASRLREATVPHHLIVVEPVPCDPLVRDGLQVFALDKRRHASRRSVHWVLHDTGGWMTSSSERYLDVERAVARPLHTIAQVNSEEER